MGNTFDPNGLKLAMDGVSKALGKLLFILCLFISARCFSEGAMEHYHVKYSQISKAVHRDTIGTLSIYNWTQKTGKNIISYQKKPNGFILSKYFDIKKDTIPFSTWGLTGWRTNDSIYRFPITAKENDYLQIVIDVQKEIRAWVNLQSLEISFMVDVILFEAIKGKKWDTIINPILSGPWKVKVCEEPNESSKSFDLLLGGWDPLFFKAMESSGGYVKVDRWVYSQEAGKSSIKPLGWIRVKDKEGKLLIWVITSYSNSGEED